MKTHINMEEVEAAHPKYGEYKEITGSDIWYLALKNRCAVFPGIPARKIGLLNTQSCALDFGGDRMLFINLAYGIKVPLHKDIMFFLYPSTMEMQDLMACLQEGFAEQVLEGAA